MAQGGLNGLNPPLRLTYRRLGVPISVKGPRCGGKARLLFWAKGIFEVLQRKFGSL